MKRVDYEEFYSNVYNKEWCGWKNLGDIMKIIEDSGSKSIAYPNSKVKHALNFLNNYLVEIRVKELMHLNWYDSTHEFLYAKVGEAKPDFKNNNGESYELKQRWSLYDATKCNWYNADHKLLLLKSDNSLYEYFSKECRFEKICYLRAPFIDIKRYPYDDIDLGI